MYSCVSSNKYYEKKKKEKNSNHICNPVVFHCFLSCLYLYYAFNPQTNQYNANNNNPNRFARGLGKVTRRFSLSQVYVEYPPIFRDFTSKSREKELEKTFQREKTLIRVIPTDRASIIPKSAPRTGGGRNKHRANPENNQKWISRKVKVFKILLQHVSIVHYIRGLKKKKIRTMREIFVFCILNIYKLYFYKKY